MITDAIYYLKILNQHCVKPDLFATTGDQTMTNEQIRKNFIEGKLTWADLLVITGLQANQLYEILSDLFDSY